MKLVRLDDLFDVRYGSNLELNALKLSPSGINFVSRTAKNNGVSARVAPVAGLEPIPSGVLTVAGGGSVLETFLQPEPFYSGRDLYYLTPLHPMSDKVKLFYAHCIRSNKYRYSYGRQANKTLKGILLPSLSDLPEFVSKARVGKFTKSSKAVLSSPIPPLRTNKWMQFRLGELFDVRKGLRLTKANMLPGQIPYVGASDADNGITAYIGQSAIHQGGTISVSYNGSVGEAFFQPEPHWATDDVNVLYPLGFELTPEIAMFICALIRQEKYRFSYGRKWHQERMRESVIKLPVTKQGQPDFCWMEQFIKTLPYSANIS